MRLAGGDVEQAVERAVEASVSRAIERAFPAAAPVGPLGDPRPIPAAGSAVALAQLRPEGPSRDGRPYYLDEPWKYWIVQNPKHLPGKLIDVQTLRLMADTYDVARSCILYIQGEAAATPLEVVPRDPEAAGASAARVKEVEQWLTDDGALGGSARTRRQFEDTMIEDALVVGAYAVWYQLNKRGEPMQAFTIDASTIRPRVESRFRFIAA